MTPEELAKIPFRFANHISMEHEHCTTYINEDYDFGFCNHVAVRKDGTFGRSYTHYRYGGKVYKTKAKFLEAIKHIVPIKKKGLCTRNPKNPKL